VVRKPAAAGKDLHLKWPRAETPTHYITMGLNDDLNACATLAVREMIDFLMTEKHLSATTPTCLSSVAADLHITELVDGNKGVHMMLPKSIFTGESGTGDKNPHEKRRRAAGVAVRRAVAVLRP